MKSKLLYDKYRKQLINLHGITVLIIAIAEIVYTLLLIVECIKSQGKTTTEKVFSCIGVWFAVMYLFFGVYIYRLVRLTILKKRLNQSTQAI